MRLSGAKWAALILGWVVLKQKVNSEGVRERQICKSEED